MSKPGFKTSEFYFAAVAVILSVLVASGVVGEGTQIEKVIAGALNVLATLGYTGARLLVKRAEIAAAPRPSDG